MDKTCEILVRIPSNAAPFGGPGDGQHYELEVTAKPAPSPIDDLDTVDCLAGSISVKADSGDHLGALQAGAESVLEIHQALVPASEDAVQATLIRPLDDLE